MKEYFKIIELKSELSKSLLILPYGINSFFTFKPSKITLAQVICITYSVQFFWTVLDEPYYKGLSSNELTNSSERGFVQTNSSKGGFVRKVRSTFFFIFFYFSFIIFFLSSPFFPFFPLSFSWWPLDVSEGHNYYKGKGGGVVCFRLFNWKKNDYKLLRKVSTITV